MASWTKEHVQHFIEIYRKYECLWKVTCREYSNKAVKEQAYAELTQYVKTFDPQASKETVTKKIANLRTTFRKEYKKVESSKVSGAGAQDIIVPKLWYFEDLMFLKDQDTVRKARSNVEEETTQPLLDDFDTEFETQEGVATAYDSDGEPQDNTSVQHMVSPLSTPRSGTPTSASGKQFVQTPTIQPQKEVKKAAKKRKGQDEDLLALACDTLKSSKDQDRHDTFGKNVANSLRQMTIEQQIFAEKIISDVLFEGRLGNLNRMTRFDLGSQYAPTQPLPTTSTSYSTQMPHSSAYYPQPGSTSSMESYRSYDNYP